MSGSLLEVWNFKYKKLSVLTLMCVSIERWRAITGKETNELLAFKLLDPLANQIWKTFHAIPCIWVIAMILSLPEPFTLQIYSADYERKNLETTWGSRCKESWGEAFQQKYQVAQTLFLFFVPLLIISGLCVHMSLILRRKAPQVSPSSPNQPHRTFKCF